MTEQIAVRLLEAIAANRLVLVCGAGLSMAPPSNLPSAARVARTCSDAYTRHTGTILDVDIQEDVTAISRFFRASQRFENFFIATLVPWPQLTGTPNPGHAAIADLLACRALTGAFTTNVDVLVEAVLVRIAVPDLHAEVMTQFRNLYKSKF